MVTVNLRAQDYYFEPSFIPSAVIAEPAKVEEKPIIPADTLPKLDLEITKEYQDQKRAELATILFKNLKQIQHLLKGKCKHEGCQKIRLAMNSYVHLQLEEHLKTLKQTNPRYKARNVISKILLVSTLVLWTGSLGAFLAFANMNPGKGEDPVLGLGLMALVGGFISLIPGIGFFVRAPRKQMFRGCCLNKSSDIFAFLKDCKVPFKKKHYLLRVSPSGFNNPNKLKCVFAFAKDPRLEEHGLNLARYEDVTPNEIALATPVLQN